jgi:hypothetical protein
MGVLVMMGAYTPGFTDNPNDYRNTRWDLVKQLPHDIDHKIYQAVAKKRETNCRWAKDLKSINHDVLVLKADRIMDGAYPYLKKPATREVVLMVGGGGGGESWRGGLPPSSTGAPIEIGEVAMGCGNMVSMGGGGSMAYGELVFNSIADVDKRVKVAVDNGTIAIAWKDGVEGGTLLYSAHGLADVFASDVPKPTRKTMINNSKELTLIPVRLRDRSQGEH